MYVVSKCRKAPGDGSQIPLKALPLGRRTCAEVRSWQELSTRAHGDRASLIHPGERCSKVQIVVQSALHHRYQDWIVEPSPPMIKR
jgi:hypothetical protein